MSSMADGAQPSDEVLRRVFAAFDSDGSGAVSVDEMSSMVKELKLDLSAEQVRRLVDEADLDNETPHLFG